MSRDLEICCTWVSNFGSFIYFDTFSSSYLVEMLFSFAISSCQSFVMRSSLTNPRTNHPQNSRNPIGIGKNNIEIL